MCNFHLSFVRAFCLSFVRVFNCIALAWFFQALSLFNCSNFAILIGMSMPKFLQSCMMVSGCAPNCLNVGVRFLHNCNGYLWLVYIHLFWLVFFFRIIINAITFFFNKKK